MIPVCINIGERNVYKRLQTAVGHQSEGEEKHLHKQDEALHPAHVRDPVCRHLR